MRPVCQTVGSAVAGPWIPLDYIESWFGVSLFVTLSEDASGITYTVDFTGDDTGPVGVRPVKISRTTTVATVTDVGPSSGQYPYDTGAHHGLVTADSVVIQSSGSANLDGTFPVASAPSPTTYTYTVANSGPAADNGNAKVNALRVFSHTVLTAQTVRNFGTFNYPVRATRLRLSAWTAGQATLCILQGAPRG
jgi:hypothetical protein